MNKFYLFLTIIVIGVFLGIFYLTQGESLFKALYSVKPTPILSDESSSLKLISPSPIQAQTLIRPNVQEAQIEKVQPTFGVAAEIKASYSAVVKTSKGDIELTLYGKEAPKTVMNFINKAKNGYYKDLAFHRVEDWVVQGGDPKGDGTGGGLMDTELNTMPFMTGSLGVAKRGDIQASNDSQFFITKSDASWLNEQYTNFGIVTNGMDVVNKIEIGDKILGIEIR